MAHLQLVFEKAEFFQDRVRGPCDDVIVCLQFLNVLLAQRLAFAGATARGDLTGDTTPVPWWREVLAWATRGLAHAPDKMLGFLLRLRLIVRYIAAQQITKIVLGDCLLGFGSGGAIHAKELFGHVERGEKRHIRIAMPGGPLGCFRAGGARHPDGRVRFLYGHDPGIDDTIMIMLALPAEGARRGPGFDDQVVRFLKALAVISRIGIRGDAFNPSATHKAGDNAAIREN